MKYLILGAGPAGLAFACYLRHQGEDSFLVLEKEASAGGLCRSEIVDDSPLDIGGGHFLDVRRPQVVNFLFQYMPREEWNLYKRDSRIDLGESMISSPIEANLWQLPLADQVRYLKSIAIAGCNLDKPMPEKFTDWIYWKLGKCIAEEYMLPYNQKMFGKDLDKLGTYWLDKLPNVSFDETLLGCLQKKALGAQPGHAEFYYPQAYGYGELWLRMADSLGDQIQYNTLVSSIDFDSLTVNDTYQADNIIFTIPWTGLQKITGMPSSLHSGLGNLFHTSLDIDYYGKSFDTNAQWIYCPKPELSYHRILVRSNFCPDSRGYWTETNSERSLPLQKQDVRYHCEYAYPLNTIGKPQFMQKLLTWAQNKRVYGLGRWGEWMHYNSDVVVDRALALAQTLLPDEQ